MNPPANLFGQDQTALLALLDELGEPAYRARQLYAWLYEKRQRDIAAMTDLSQLLRERLSARHSVAWPEVVRRDQATDETLKYLLRLADGATVEAVLIPKAGRRTICISTQAGCPLKCAFCLTGVAGFKRNLDSGEILGQVAVVMSEAAEQEPGDERPWNIVVMGMGEPLLNYDATLTALRILMDPRGFAVPPRRLTLSTVGILPALEKLAQEPVRPNLAISLHAPDSELRRRLMPIEARYPLDAVIEATRRYQTPRGGRVTFEYVLLHEVNDSAAHARKLARLLSGVPAKVNLIPLNPAPEIPFEAPSDEALDEFCRILSESRVTVSVRRSRGQDILAACGQLHLKQQLRPDPAAAS